MDTLPITRYESSLQSLPLQERKQIFEESVIDYLSKLEAKIHQLESKIDQIAQESKKFVQYTQASTQNSEVQFGQLKKTNVLCIL